MKPNGHSSANGFIGRADLLRLLAMSPRPVLLLDDDGEHQFGYWQQEIPNQPDQSVGTIIDPLPEKPPVQTGHFKLPLQMPFVHVIAERQSREPLSQQQNSAEAAAVFNPITEDDAKAPEAKRLVNYEDLVPKARLLPALKRYLAGNRTRGLDVPLLVKQLAEQQLPRHLPRRQLKTWHPQWVVVLDFAKRLWPYRQDMHQLAEHLLHACGQSGVSIRIINHGPLQDWTDWVEEQRAGGALPAKHTGCTPPAGTPVLLVSDLGLLEGTESSSRLAWQGFIRQLLKSQIRPLALLPLGAEQLDGGLHNNLPLLRWSPDARIRPERALGKGQAKPEGLLDLLAMAAVTRRVDPPLLRAMRRLNPKAPLNAGLEGAFWCHADVESGSAANIRHEAQAKYLDYFVQQLDSYHLALEQLRYRHHAHLRAGLNHEETLLWKVHARLDEAEVSAETKQRITNAYAFMHQLASTLRQPDGLQKGGVWWQVAQDIVQRADNLMGYRYTDLFSPLVAAIAEVRGDFEQVPDWIDPAELKRHMRGEKVSCWLVRDPLNGNIALQRIPATQNQSTLGEPLTIDAGGIRIESHDKKQWYPAPQFANALCRLNEETTVKLTTSAETLTLATIKRPRGASAWGCDKTGFWLKTPAFSGKDWRWQAADLRIARTNDDDQRFRLGSRSFRDIGRQFELSKNSESLYGQILQDDQNFSVVDFDLDDYGVLARLAITTKYSSLEAQNFRWIAPGSFWMGSPYDEQERGNNEGPRHEVTISQGFWLADTASTQAFWQAVMGNNPSRFQDDPNQPVEQVNWRQVQEFIQRLQVLLPGCQVDLPSEAEWEYVCRAGTDRPFSFGVNITPQQVNYDGNIPYAGGEKGEYRGKTVAVKSLPANPWGLYEMHGNVWEWCKDGQRTYDEQAQVDPLGPVTGEELPRVIRGGSWSDRAGWARSAFRIAFLPGGALDDLGFRFCLRSIEPGQEKVSPAGSPGRASEVSPNATQKGGNLSKSVAKSKPGSKPKRGS